MKDEISELINQEVQRYSDESYDYLNEVKILVFTSLIAKLTYDSFKRKFDDLNKKYEKTTNKKSSKGFKKVKKITSEKNEETSSEDEIKFSKKEKEDLVFELDKSSQVKARDKFIKETLYFYKRTYKVVKKDYVNVEAYLIEKIKTYTKIEKVVPYFSKNGKIRAYFDIASYNAMVYNTNLVSCAWNETINYCYHRNIDIVYVEPHPYSCPLCQKWQGKFYSLTGKTKGYPNIKEAYSGGLKHPNCKHNITTDVGQKETSDYSSGVWEDRYEARQKKQALELKKKRLITDKKIYEELGDFGTVDKINAQIKNINQSIREQKKLMG